MSDPLFSASCKHPKTVAALKRQLSPTRPERQPPYPETINLPFNRQALPDGFVLHPTPQPVTDADGIWVLLQSGTLLMREAGNELLLPEGPCPDWLKLKQPALSFASLQGRPVRVASVPSVPSDQQIPPELVAEPFNAFGERITPELMSIAGTGKQLLHWQRMSRFCSHCSGALEQLPETWGKKCVSCGNEHFPHIHPCAIVVIRRDDQLLLIHKPEWPVGVVTVWWLVFWMSVSPWKNVPYGKRWKRPALPLKTCAI